MLEPYRICISSPPDRKYVVAEIFFGDNQWAEVNQERGFFEVEFYSPPDGRPLHVTLDDAVKALQHAKDKLSN